MSTSIVEAIRITGFSMMMSAIIQTVKAASAGVNVQRKEKKKMSMEFFPKTKKKRPGRIPERIKKGDAVSIHAHKGDKNKVSQECKELSSSIFEQAVKLNRLMEQIWKS